MQRRVLFLFSCLLTSILSASDRFPGKGRVLGSSSQPSREAPASDRAARRARRAESIELLRQHAVSQGYRLGGDGGHSGAVATPCPPPGAPGRAVPCPPPATSRRKQKPKNNDTDNDRLLAQLVQEEENSRGGARRFNPLHSVGYGRPPVRQPDKARVRQLLPQQAANIHPFFLPPLVQMQRDAAGDPHRLQSLLTNAERWNTAAWCADLIDIIALSSSRSSVHQGAALASECGAVADFFGAGWHGPDAIYNLLFRTGTRVDRMTESKELGAVIRKLSPQGRSKLRKKQLLFGLLLLLDGGLRYVALKKPRFMGEAALLGMAFGLWRHIGLNKTYSGLLKKARGSSLPTVTELQGITQIVSQEGGVAE